MMASVPIRVRLTLWYAAILAIILAAFGAGVYLTLRHALYSNLDESIEFRAGALLDAVQYDGERPTLLTEVTSDDPTELERYARVFNTSGGITFDSSVGIETVPVNKDFVDRALSGQRGTRRDTAEGDDDQIRVITLPIRRDGQIVGVLEVGESEEDVSGILGTLLLIMGVTYAVTLVVAVLGGSFLAGRALSPVDRITNLARRITAEDLGQRLDFRLPDDEVGRLARTFDEMIGRLHEAFRRQRQFTTDASHELRTPLTIMKGQVDVALQKQRDPEDYRQVLQEVNEEVDRLIHLTASLLTLTRADAGAIPLALEGVDVAGVVSGAVEHMSATALQKGIDLRFVSDGSATIRADEDLLLQLLLNLVDNAIKHTPSGGRVTVGWGRTDSRVELWVQDTGIGIPEQHVPLIFDRFYRVDKARSRTDGGVGLGLAISRWIAEAHGGSIRVTSVPGEGSTFTVLVPLNS